MPPRSGERVAIIAEHTPNPESVKFAAHPPVRGSGGREFADLAEALAASPLATRLLRLGGVARVYVGPGFVTVSRSPGADWGPLGRQVSAALRAHLASGAPWVAEASGSEVPEPDDDGDDDGIVARIRELIERDILPTVRRDGGDVAFVGFANGVVRVALRGACVGCPAAERTLRMGIERRLRQAVPDVVSVEAG